MSKFEWTNADQLDSFTEAQQYGTNASKNQIIDIDVYKTRADRFCTVY